MKSVIRERGKICPNCGEQYAQEINTWEIDEVPHTDPKDCIRHLRKIVDQMHGALERHNFI